MVRPYRLEGGPGPDASGGPGPVGPGRTTSGSTLEGSAISGVAPSEFENDGGSLGETGRIAGATVGGTAVIDLDSVIAAAESVVAAPSQGEDAGSAATTA